MRPNAENSMSKLLTAVALLAMISVGHAEMPHNRPCDIAQDHPGNLNPDGGNAIMFGLCGGIEDLPTGESPSRHHVWSAYSCGYQAYRQGKVFGANPYYNDELETRWSAGWKDAQKACQTGKGPFDSRR
jgi:ribosome modulation factor